MSYPCRIPDAVIVEARERRASGERVGEIALCLGLSQARTSDICQGKAYQHVGGPITVGARVPLEPKTKGKPHPGGGIVYAMAEPLHRGGNVRYVGQAITTLGTKLSNGVGGKKTSRLGAWARELRAAGARPIIFPLEYIDPQPGEALRDVLDAAEIRWIAKLRDDRFALLNEREGGHRPTGFHVTEEHRARISKANKGQVPWLKGLSLDDPRIERMAAKQRGRTPWNKGVKMPGHGWAKGLTKETDERIRRTGELNRQHQTGRKASEETKAKMRASALAAIARRKEKASDV